MSTAWIGLGLQVSFFVLAAAGVAMGAVYVILGRAQKHDDPENKKQFTYSSGIAIASFIAAFAMFLFGCFVPLALTAIVNR